MKTLISVLSILAPVILVANSHAMKGNPDHWCRSGGFPEEGPTFSVGRIVGGKAEKIHFLGDDDQCPDEGGKKCEKKPYLIAGDQVIVARKYKNWVCSRFVNRNKKGKVYEVTGWLPAEQVKLTNAESNPAASKWIGEWSDGYQTIDISEGQNGALTINGTATWDGGNGNTHEGQAEGQAKPNGNRLSIGDRDGLDCDLDLFLVDRYLVAVDNGKCGGVNVRFNSVYLKK